MNLAESERKRQSKGCGEHGRGRRDKRERNEREVREREETGWINFQAH